MKKVIYLTGVLALLTLTGCLIAEGGRGHGRHGGHSGSATLIVPAPVVVVPVVRVHH